MSRGGFKSCIGCWLRYALTVSINFEKKSISFSHSVSEGGWRICDLRKKKKEKLILHMGVIACNSNLLSSPSGYYAILAYYNSI